MAEKKHALLIFTKPPLPGIVKTRMTTEYGGFFTMEQAAGFYRNCFYDVCAMGMQALMELQAENDAAVAADPTTDKITYDFFCSSPPMDGASQMQEVFDVLAPWPMQVNYIVDKGKSFDDHFNDACQQLFDRGYESFVAIGGDVPTMPKAHIKQGFQWLDYFQSIGKPGFVYAPCQASGTSLVGYSYNTPIDHTGVYYNMDGRPALTGYLEKIQEGEIPSAYFDPVADIDEIGDLGHAVSCMKSIREAAKYQDLFVPERSLRWVEFMGITVTTPPNDNHDPRDLLDADDDALIETEELSAEDRQRMSDLSEALRGKEAAENAYEASKYE